MVDLSFLSDVRSPRKKIVTVAMRDMIVSDLEQLAEKHQVALSTIGRMASAQARNRNQ